MCCTRRDDSRELDGQTFETITHMDAYNLRPGDLLACYGTDLASRIISFVTSSFCRPSELRIAPSHVGICVEHPSQGVILVESTSSSGEPCLVHGARVSGVQAHYPDRRVREFTDAGGRVDVWRLNPYWDFTEVESLYLWDHLRRHFRRQTKYELRGRLTMRSRFLRRCLSWLRADSQIVFSAEFVAAILMRVFRLPLDNATRYSPASLLRRLCTLNFYQFGGPVTALSCV